MWGLSPIGHGNSRFLTDTQWPAILGETGYIGCALFLYGLFRIWQTFWRLRERAEPEVVWAARTAQSWFVLLLVCSIAVPVLVSGSYIAFLFGAAGVCVSMSAGLGIPGGLHAVGMIRTQVPRRRTRSHNNVLENRYNFAGLSIDALTMDQSLDACLSLLREGKGHQHVVLNASKTVLAQDDPYLRDIINNCSIVNADGQSVVWAAKLLNIPVPERVAGIDLMDRLLARAREEQLSVYLLGAQDQVVAEVARKIGSGGVNVVGWNDGYWNADNEADVISRIAQLAPDILFVAMPSPRKEYFLAAHLADLQAGLAFGVGGSFDVIAGRTKRAPRWMRSSGLEWLYRLIQEPRRMFMRYLVGNTRFCVIVLKEKLNQYRNPRSPLGK